ncbi:hypothetical protein [Nocardia wallacei]|uniref:hypothetical protein n=1 Tax=Nocardia wallacei TaxID=480035 RepID=UPI0024544157|nr:hypothetical protein [Nocardia wallacei]
MTELPDHMMIVGDDGQPLGVVDVARLQCDATVLMYRLAAAAGDDAAVDRVAETWLSSVEPDYAGYVSATALSLMTRCVVAPLLEVVDRALPDVDFRAKLAESRDNAVETLGGGAG